MVHKADAAYSDAKGISLWRHKLRRGFKGPLSDRAAFITVMAISLTLWVVIFKVVGFFLVG